MKLLEISQVHQALKLITKSVVVTRQRVQNLAEQACAYSIIHGDISVGVKLLEAVGVNKSLRKDSLVAYFEKYGNFAWSKADKKLSFFASHKVGTLTTEQEALIVGAKWDEAKREPGITSLYDMEAECRRFIDRMHKLAAQAKPSSVLSDGTVVAGIVVDHAEALQAVEQAFAKWSAESTLAAMKADQDVLDAGEAQQRVADAKAAAMEVSIPSPEAVKVAA